MALREDQQVKRNYACNFIAAELANLRPGGMSAASRHRVADTDIGLVLGAAPLELLSLATTFSEALHLHQSSVADELLERWRVDDSVYIAPEGLRRLSGAMSFCTSGSIRQARPSTPRSDALWKESRQLVQLVGTRHRFLCAVPSHHIYGSLFSVLLQRAFGPDVIGLTSTAPCPDELANAWASSGLLKHRRQSRPDPMIKRAPAADSVLHSLLWSDLSRTSKAPGSHCALSRLTIRSQLCARNANDFEPSSPGRTR